MTKTPPIITSEQRSIALEKANLIRKQRVRIKKQLKENEITFEDLFSMPKDNLAATRLKVVAALESLPGVGKVKARRIMEEIEIPETRRIGGLGDKQKQKILSTLNDG